MKPLRALPAVLLAASTMHMASAADTTGAAALRPPVAGNSPEACRPALPEADRVLSADESLPFIRCLLDRGNTALAILLLQQLRAAEPSNQAVAALLDEHLGALPQPAAPRGFVAPWGAPVTVSGWLAAELGHDSNINRATSAQVIDIPLLNYRSLALPELLVERPSSFASLTGSIAASVPLTSGLRASVQGQAGLRGHFSELAYAPHNYLVAAQVESEVGDTTLGIGAAAGQQWVAKYRLLERSAIRAQAITRATPDLGIAISAELATNSYPLFQGVKTRETSVELRASYRPWNLYLGAYQGQEASRTAIKDLDRSFDGVSAGWRPALNDSWRLAIDASSGRSRYTQFSRLFATQRKDRLTNLSLAAQIRLGDGWSLTPKLTLERTDSSVALNGYRRTQYLAELRRDF